MTIQFADDSAYTTGVVAVTFGVLGAPPGIERVGEDVTFWGGLYLAATDQRRTFEVTGYPIKTLSDAVGYDSGTWDCLHEAFRTKPYKRISACTLPRVSRKFSGGVPGAVFEFWDDATDGVLPLPVELKSSTRATWNRQAREAFTLQLVSPVKM